MAGFETLGAGVGGLIALLADTGGGTRQYRQAVQAWRDLENADFDLSRLTAPQLQVVAEVFPELVTAQVPGEAERARLSTDPALRGAQMESLGQLQDVAREGLPTVDRLAAQRAQETIRRAQRGGMDAELAQLAARGRLSGGDEIAARMIGQQQATNLSADMGRDLATDAALRRLAASGEAAGLAGTIRGQDTSQQVAQADINQRFNELLYGILQSNAQQNAARSQEAQMWNAANRQNVANQNPLLQYGTAAENINRYNTLLQQLFGQDLARTQGLTGALTGYGQQRDVRAANQAAGIANLGRGVGAGLDALWGLGKTTNGTTTAPDTTASQTSPAMWNLLGNVGMVAMP